MKFLTFVALSLKLSAALAAPAPTSRYTGPIIIPISEGNTPAEPIADGGDSGNSPPVVEEPAATPPVATPPVETPPPVADPVEGEPAEGGEGGEGGEGEEGEGGEEVELEAAFGDTVALEGGDLKQDVLYPPSDIGLFEVEFQNTEARTLTVTENPAPAAPPTGFTHLENSTYIVEIDGGTEGLTLQKIDYILNADSALDISQGQIGRFCAEAGAFVIDPAIGELEFEVEENELTLTVNNMNGEWGVFLPTAAGDGTETETGEGNAPTPGSTLLDALLAFIRGDAGAGA